MSKKFIDSFMADGALIHYYSIAKAAAHYGFDFTNLPASLRILLENSLRHLDNKTVTDEDIQAFGNWLSKARSDREIAFHPTRVLMQDFTGVPAVVDLAAMRQAMTDLGGNPSAINPLTPVDLVIDHSVQVDFYGNNTAFSHNVSLEMERNKERYSFLRWGQESFKHFRVVPPGTGICHQVNLEYLARVVWTDDREDRTFAYPDTVVGTDSHTTMINGLSVLGWGVGGIEAEAAMLGQPISMLLPEVVGFELTEGLREGTTATDMVLTVTQMLRERGVVGKFVEFYGPGLSSLSLADRATISNMAPEYGATCGFMPVDDETLNYLKLTGRGHLVPLVEAYAKKQGLWNDVTQTRSFTDRLHLDLSTVEPSLAGPKRPQDRVALSKAPDSMRQALVEWKQTPAVSDATIIRGIPDLGHGDIVIAAITSCTNTSNPAVMLAAGLVAKNARARGLLSKPWVKTSLAPGSQVVSEYLDKSGLQTELDALGFQVVGYGCTTCIGNSGPLHPDIEAVIKAKNLSVSSILSGNRNFEGRVHPLTKANYLASPPLVVAYALAGTMNINLTTDPLGLGSDGAPVYLKDIWPSNADIQRTIRQHVNEEMFARKYAGVFEGDATWKSMPSSKGLTYGWDAPSTYIRNPPYFKGITLTPPTVKHIENARILALLGDSITTDHISPAGSIAANSPAATYLTSHGVERADFNSYGARRGNHEVMMRGTFANIRIRNEMAPGREGGVTTHHPSGQVLSIYDAAMLYQREDRPLVVIAGKEYGTGSSRDWAAKGPRLLGIRAVIAESYERIHRSNLVGMGILPLEFTDGMSRKTLALKGDELLSIMIPSTITPRMMCDATITRADGSRETISLRCRIDTAQEVDYFLHGGILHYVLRKLAGS